MTDPTQLRKIINSIIDRDDNKQINTREGIKHLPSIYFQTQDTSIYGPDESATHIMKWEHNIPWDIKMDEGFEDDWMNKDMEITTEITERIREYLQTFPEPWKEHGSEHLSMTFENTYADLITLRFGDSTMTLIIHNSGQY